MERRREGEERREQAVIQPILKGCRDETCLLERSGGERERARGVSEREERRRKRRERDHHIDERRNILHFIA